MSAKFLNNLTVDEFLYTTGLTELLKIGGILSLRLFYKTRRRMFVSGEIEE